MNTLGTGRDLLRRVRGALGLGLLWGIVWAVIGGGIMEGIVDPRGEVLDMWPQVLGLVGFLGGVVFAGLLAVTGGRRSFGEFSFREFAVMGVVAGVLQGVLAMMLVGAPLPFIGVAALASGVSALGSLGIARMAAPPRDGGELADPDAERDRRRLGSR